MWQKLVPILLDWTWGRLIKPALNWLYKKGKSTVQKIKIKKSVKKIKKAENENEFDNSFDDLA